MTFLLMSLSVLGLVVTLFVTAPTPTTSALGALTPATSYAVVQAVGTAGHGIRQDEPLIPVAAPAASVVVTAAPTEPAEAAAPAVAAPAAAPLVALPLLTADVWNAAERYFAISGDSAQDLLASGRANVPADPTGSERHAMAYAGPSLWQHQPTYVIDGATGECTMTGVTSTVAYQATLPQWTSPATVQPGLLAWWRIVLEHIRVHEGQHIHIFTDYVNALPGRVAGQACGSWDSIVQQWTADIVSAQSAFDTAEAGWAYPRFP